MVSLGLVLRFRVLDMTLTFSVITIAAPQVAGLVAYFRALPGAAADPESIQSLIMNAKRAIDETNEDADLVAWNK